MECFGFDSSRATFFGEVTTGGLATIAAMIARETTNCWRRAKRNSRYRFPHSTLVFAAVTGFIANMMATGAMAAVTCKPILSVKNVQDVRTSTVPEPWTWNATIHANPTFCATRSGSFEIDFVRIKEYAPDLQFTAKFQWVSGQFDVTIEGADEAIHDYRIGFCSASVAKSQDRTRRSARGSTTRGVEDCGALGLRGEPGLRGARHGHASIRRAAEPGGNQQPERRRRCLDLTGYRRAVLRGSRA
jgi:hypothetical protein